MATEQQKQELKEKIMHLVNTRYNGSIRGAFQHYSGMTAPLETLDRDELMRLLKDAGIGNFATRGAWADGVLEAVDSNKNKRISWDELESLLR